MRSAVVALLLAALAGPAAAAGLEAGAPEGAERTARSEGHRVYLLPMGPFTPSSLPVLRLEGEAVQSAWRLAPGATVDGAVRFYRDRLEAEGFRVLFECRDRGCGGFDFRFGVELVEPPAMLMDTAAFAQLSMAAPDGRHASVLASRVLGQVYVQTVMVAAEGPPAAPAQPAALPAPAVDAAVPADDAGLVERLRRDGRVVLDGLVFEPGGAALAAGSEAALARVAGALRDTGLAVTVVGHSDTVGGYEANLALSRRRAEAVREALVARGLPAARVDARGASYLAPLAPNATAEGRALNRRVELVLR